jgi:uncharacterized membrane protein YeaQ/YmgE (transglycosylase-associated protein family)
MTLPALLFGFCVSTLLGGIFHLWKDGGLGRLILNLLLGWIGFAIGHILGNQMGWGIVDVGPLHLGTALVGCVALLFFGHWLSLIQVEKQA